MIPVTAPPLPPRRASAQLTRGFDSAWLALWIGLSAGCIELSPFETDLDRHESGVTEAQLARLASLPRPVGAFSFALVSDSHEQFDRSAAGLTRST
jgi:hypothetical protein